MKLLRPAVGRDARAGFACRAGCARFLNRAACASHGELPAKSLKSSKVPTGVINAMPPANLKVFNRKACTSSLKPMLYQGPQAHLLLDRLPGLAAGVEVQGQDILGKARVSDFGGS